MRIKPLPLMIGILLFFSIVGISKSECKLKDKPANIQFSTYSYMGQPEILPEIQMRPYYTGSCVNTNNTVCENFFSNQKIYQNTVIKNGWPQHTDGNLTHISKIIVEDLDTNGMKDIIVEADDGKIYAWDYAGNNLPGWPVISSSFMGGHVAPSSIGDIDNDGDMELVSCPKDLIQEGGIIKISLVSAWDHMGNILQNFPVFIEYPEGYSLFWWHGMTNPVLIDLDNDNDLEIIVCLTICENDGNGWISYWKFFAYHHNGSIVDGWPFIIHKVGDETPYGGGTPAAADVDNDGEVEVVVAVNLLGDTEIWGQLYLLNMNGDIEEGNWPIVTNDHIYSAPALADFDLDNDYEIVFGSSMDDSRYFVVDHLGNNLPGWPRDDLGYLSLVSAPAIGDLDGDCIPEIIQANGVYWNNKVFAWHIDGSNVNGWPVSFDPGNSTWCSPIIGDITGDDIPEIIVGNSDSRIYAWHSNGSRVNGWPKTIESTPFVTPAISDLEYDGEEDLIVASYSGFVYVWTTTDSYNPNTMHWVQFHHDAQHTGLYNGTGGFDVPPIVNLTKPEKSLYVYNRRILPFFIPLIIGKITIEANATDNFHVDRVEFYIDDVLQANDTTEPYSWTWNSKTLFSHTIKVIAYDNAFKSDSDEITVWKFF